MLTAEFKEGDIVWARNSNRSWWPAIIKTLLITNNKYSAIVTFIGKQLEKRRLYSSLRPFAEDEEFMKVQSKNPELFLSAIDTAKRMQEEHASKEGKLDAYIDRSETVG